MSFLDTIIKLDQDFLIYLNNFGTKPFDELWLTITRPANWFPLILLWLALLIKAFGWKKGLFFFFFAAAMGGLSDALVNCIKYTTLRPRPCWQEGVLEHIRILKCTHSYSFVSGHATTSMAITTFMYLLLKNRFKWSVVFYIFPLVFAYSRIYMGKHYPLDIVLGYVLGIIEAILYVKLARYLISKWFVKIAKT